MKLRESTDIFTPKMDVRSRFHSESVFKCFATRNIVSFFILCKTEFPSCNVFFFPFLLRLNFIVVFLVALLAAFSSKFFFSLLAVGFSRISLLVYLQCVIFHSALFHFHNIVTNCVFFGFAFCFLSLIYSCFSNIAFSRSIYTFTSTTIYINIRFRLVWFGLVLVRKLFLGSLHLWPSQIASFVLVLFFFFIFSLFRFLVLSFFLFVSFFLLQLAIIYIPTLGIYCNNGLLKPGAY